MKTLALALALSAALAALALPTAGAQDGVAVSLEVGTYAGVDVHDCAVVVPAGATVAAILDQAVADGCILSWSAVEYPGYGRFVDCIDGVCGSALTYWALYVDGQYGETGVDTTFAQEGGVYRFQHEQWALPVML